MLVDDPNAFSEKTIEHLKGMVDIVIHKKDIGKKIETLGFIFISASQVKFEENDYFAFVNKGTFEEARRNKELLKNIIKTYKKEIINFVSLSLSGKIIKIILRFCKL